MRGVGLELGAYIFVVRQLGLFGKLGSAVRRSVSIVHGAANVFQRVVPFVRAGVVVPVLVDRPELVGRDEFFQAFQRWNGFVIAFFG